MLQTMNDRLDEVWEQLIAEAAKNPSEAGGEGFAEFLAVKNANDQIRETSTRWLLDTMRQAAEHANVKGVGITIENQDAHRFSIDKMRARKEAVIDTLSGGLAQLAKRRGVRVITARGIFVDSQTLQLEGSNDPNFANERLTFEHCILATGSVPAMPPWKRS